MAIPVSNPPPKYEPVPPRPSDDDEPPSIGPSPMGPGGRDPRRRGCVIVLGVAGALSCVVSIAMALSCQSCVQIGESQGIRKMTSEYRRASVELHLEHTHASDLDQLEALGDAGEVSLVAFGVLHNRFADAVADGHVDADELHLGMELVHDIVLGHGAIDMSHYPAAR